MNLSHAQKLKWIFYIIIVALLLYMWEFEFRSFIYIKRIFLTKDLPKDVQPNNEQHVIVLDAGSTGTRLSIFKFASTSSVNRTLQGGYSEKSTPGLSSYVHDPDKVEEYMTYLLDKAKTMVPIERWKGTLITFKATASLRSLSKNTSSTVLTKVHEVIQTYPFYCPAECTSLLEETDEGILGWFTLNFLLGRLNDTNHTSAFIEMGGGSTQVTFAVDDPHSSQSDKKEYISTTIFKQPMTMYTHSYLGMGLYSARYSFLQMSRNSTDSSYSNVNSTVTTSCVHPLHESYSWYNNTNYIIQGQSGGNFSFESCYEKMIEFLGNRIEKVEELNTKDIYLSGFNGAAIFGKEADSYTIEQFVDSCINYCKFESPQSLFCVDCTYASAFWMHGLGLNIKKEIRLLSKISGIRLTWSLGEAINMLQ